MLRRRVFIKVSGDLCHRSDVLEWIQKVSQDQFVVVCVGGGTQINEAFEVNGLPVSFGPLGRETDDFRARQLARDTLEKNQRDVQDLLAAKGVFASVIIPFVDIATVLCPVNGDVMLTTVYLGFNTLYVVTIKEREEEKRKQFAHLSKVQVKAF